MKEAAERIGNPQNEYRSFHVAGTNGKGSVCAYLESCLRRMGFKTGLFTSPHIVDFEERFMLNGKPVSSDSWVGVYRDIEPAIEELGLTFFEAVTLIAFELFKREKLDWAVFETGLGGRLDSTNIVRPAVSVITRLAMDHSSLLGNDLISIATEKLGIVKKDIPLVMLEPDDREIRKNARDRCLRSGSLCLFVSPARVRQTDVNPCLIHHGRKYEVPLAGKYQVANALLAITALETAGFNDGEAVADGIGNTFLPGRFQTLRIQGKTVVFDVGHNPDAARAFAETFAARFPGNKACMVTGIMKDKDTAGILKNYCDVASKIILTKPDTDRSAETAELKKSVPADFDGETIEIPSVSEAVAAGMESSEEIICVAGSFFTVGEAMRALGVEPWKRADSFT